MASGLPVVATSSGGIAKLIREGENGLLCEEKNADRLAEQINRVLQDEELAGRMRTEAVHTAEAYSYKAIGRRYCDLILESV
jgi:glycosyltransferase involved in cell wall biosynthesis